jgi:transposase
VWTEKVEQSILLSERAKEMKGMAKNQKSYTPEFKQQIVDLYNAGGTSYPQLEREYGVNRSTISGWVKQLSPIRVSEGETVTLKEYKALQKENQRLKIENEILKKATAIFAKEQ